MGRRLPADTLPGYPLPIDQLVTVVLDDATLLAALPASIPELADQLGFTRTTVYNHLCALRKAGVVAAERYPAGFGSADWWEQA